jgi:hypothetical protein
MALKLNKVHEYKKSTDGSPSVLIRTSPIIRLGRRVEGEQDQTYVFIQEGEFYTEDGKILPPERRPKWLYEELAKLTPHARTEAGLKAPVEKK